MALLVGCTDRQHSPSAPEVGPLLGTAAVAGEPGPDFVIHPRFALELDVEGALKPGHPIHLTVRGEAFFPTQDAEIRLTLPEVAAAERSTWEVVELPLNEDLPPHLRTRQGFAAGERFRERATVTIPEPGYYNVTATVIQHSDDWRTDGGRLVGTGAGQSLWLWIDERGGRVTEGFDPSVFPAGTRRAPGPLGLDRKPPRLHHPGTVVTCTVSPSESMVIASECPDNSGLTFNPPPPPDQPATATVTVTYRDQGTGGTTRPLADAWVAWKVFDTSTGAEVARSGGYTNATGVSPTIDCKGPTSTRSLVVTVHTENRKAEVKNHINSNPDRTTVAQPPAVPCGGNVPVAAGDEQSHLFSNLNKTWDGHRSRFGADPPAIIRAGMYPVSARRTHYDYNAVELHIEPGWDTIWREYGVLVAAHEYGHLWQDKYLYQSPANNGLMRYYTNCPTPEHPPGNRSNFGCAWGEAFADWYAVVVRESDLPTWRRDLEENRYHLQCTGTLCTDDGSIVQGAVHAFLWDITDPTGETGDDVQKAPADVAQAVKTCEVSLQVNGSFFPYNGVDHIIWCMEDRFPYQVPMYTSTGEQMMTFFNTRPQSSWANDARGWAVDRFSNNFRRLWLRNLYSKRPGVGSYPQFRSNLEPTDEPTPPPPDEEPIYPCGGEIAC